ncbi:MAG: ADP-ribosylglycohydrolase family protein [Methanoregulaceae archaeon]
MYHQHMEMKQFFLLHTITFRKTLLLWLTRYTLLVIFISQFGRSSGTLAGLAIGDVLGAPLEGSFPPRRYITGMEPGGLHPGRRKGQYTDDTLQAVAVARSLVQCRSFSPDDMMLRLVRAYCKSPAFFGPTSSRVFESVMKGIPREEAVLSVHEHNGGSRSNGSVMRGAPLGVLFEGEELHEVSLACSRLTHWDPVSGECSAFLNQMVASLVREKSREQALARALSFCRIDEILDTLADWRSHAPVPGLDALLCTHAALASFMQAGSFEDAVLSAVNLGGDADTVGSCTGALAGAFWGLDTIPGLWRQELEDYTVIAALGTELARVART